MDFSIIPKIRGDSPEAVQRARICLNWLIFQRPTKMARADLNAHVRQAIREWAGHQIFSGDVVEAIAFWNMTMLLLDRKDQCFPCDATAMMLAIKRPFVVPDGEALCMAELFPTIWGAHPQYRRDP